MKWYPLLGAAKLKKVLMPLKGCLSYASRPLVISNLLGPVLMFISSLK